jgi:hypothetical protein
LERHQASNPSAGGAPYGFAIVAVGAVGTTLMVGAFAFTETVGDGDGEGEGAGGGAVSGSSALGAGALIDAVCVGVGVDVVVGEPAAGAAGFSSQPIMSAAAKAICAARDARVTLARRVPAAISTAPQNGHCVSWSRT